MHGFDALSALLMEIRALKRAQMCGLVPVTQYNGRAALQAYGEHVMSALSREGVVFPFFFCLPRRAQFY